MSLKAKCSKGISMNIELRGAILQRDKETYAIVPRVPVGLLTTENLDKLGLVIKKYNIPVVKIVSGREDCPGWDKG